MNTINTNTQHLGGLDVCSDPTPDQASIPTAGNTPDWHERSATAKHSRFGGMKSLQTSNGSTPDEFM